VGIGQAGIAWPYRPHSQTPLCACLRCTHAAHELRLLLFPRRFLSCISGRRCSSSRSRTPCLALWSLPSFSWRAFLAGIPCLVICLGRADWQVLHAVIAGREVAFRWLYSQVKRALLAKQFLCIAKSGYAKRLREIGKLLFSDFHCNRIGINEIELIPELAVAEVGWRGDVKFHLQVFTIRVFGGWLVIPQFGTGDNARVNAFFKNLGKSAACTTPAFGSAGVISAVTFGSGFAATGAASPNCLNQGMFGARTDHVLSSNGISAASAYLFFALKEGFSCVNSIRAPEPMARLRFWLNPTSSCTTCVL